MAWIKRNLLFVVGLAVAVALLGVGVFYLLGSMSQADSASTELETMNQKLDELVNHDPFPSNENVEKIRAQQKRVADFKQQAKVKFSEETKPESLDNASFKTVLEQTIGSLEHEAERSGVRLPDKYDFTFSEQRKKLQLAQNALSPLVTELRDLGDVCHILFEAKIHSLVSLKRPGVGSNEAPGSTDLLSKKVTTNTVAGVVIYPYEVSFQCFSSELGAVLTGLIAAPQNYVIKTVNVERGTALETPTPVAAPAAVNQGFGGMDPALARRYGLSGGRYGAPAQQPVPVAQPTVRVGETVLDEKPLKITLGLEVVKLMPSAPAPASNAPRPNPNR